MGMGKGMKINGYGLRGYRGMGYEIIGCSLFEVFCEFFLPFHSHLIIIFRRDIYQCRRNKLQSKGLRVKD
jgi:hypothetical protein